MNEPAFYARTGTWGRDLATLLHVPYTLWHLSYVAIGASLAAAVDWQRLGGTIVAFALGLGIGAHALDERHDRPLGTERPRRRRRDHPTRPPTSRGDPCHPGRP